MTVDGANVYLLKYVERNSIHATLGCPSLIITCDPKIPLLESGDLPELNGVCRYG